VEEEADIKVETTKQQIKLYQKQDCTIQQGSLRTNSLSMSTFFSVYSHFGCGPSNFCLEQIVAIRRKILRSDSFQRRFLGVVDVNYTLEQKFLEFSVPLVFPVVRTQLPCHDRSNKFICLFVGTAGVVVKSSTHAETDRSEVCLIFHVIMEIHDSNEASGNGVR
jgi:hypothetical protein